MFLVAVQRMIHIHPRSFSVVYSPIRMLVCGLLTEDYEDKGTKTKQLQRETTKLVAADTVGPDPIK